MTLISIDLQAAFNLSNTLTAQSNMLEGVYGEVQQRWRVLDSSWEGSSKHSVENALNHVLGQFGNITNRTSEMGRNIKTVAERFRAADENNPLLVNPLIWTSAPVNATTEISPYIQTHQEGGLDWQKWWFDIGSGTTGILKDLKDFKYNDFDSFGRTINSLVGNARGGWVGRMDDLGHIIKNPKFQLGVGGIGFGLGVWSGLSEGESAPKAIFSEGIKLAIDAGIKYGIKYLIPGAGQAMLVYDGALLAGRLAAGGMDVIGFHDQSAWLQNTIRTIDIGTYTEDWSNRIYDFGEYYVTHPDKIIPDFKSANKPRDFGAGLIDNGREGISY